MHWQANGKANAKQPFTLFSLYAPPSRETSKGPWRSAEVVCLYLFSLQIYACSNFFSKYPFTKIILFKKTNVLYLSDCVSRTYISLKILLFAVIKGLYLSIMEITMDGKFFYGIDIICQRTFTTVVVHFRATPTTSCVAAYWKKRIFL